VPLHGKRPHLAWKVIAAILVGIGLHVVLVHLPPHIQKHYGDLFRAAIVLLVGGAISWFFESWLNGSARDWLGAHRAASFRFMGRLVLYLSVALALLAAFGVGLSSVVFGSAFFTVILGLAGQNFFANLIAGIGLIFYRPFEVGDKVNFVAWQLGVVMPSYPHEKMKPTYSGTVRDVSLAYTTLETDEGITMKVPNGILIQAYIETRPQDARVPFRFRFDLDLALDPAVLLPKLETQLKTLHFPVKVSLADVGAATFAVVLTGYTGEPEDAARHAILRRLIPLVQELRETTAQPS
jgi:small-conductance mechanosensitive channel